jgi:hypothetical protein
MSELRSLLTAFTLHQGEMMPGHATEQRWTDAMRQGDFERAWRISDISLRDYLIAPPPKHTGERHIQRIWRGESLVGKRVLVRCYHGLGDTIQFIRFAPALRRIASEVTVWVQPPLISLIRAVDGVDQVLPLHDGTPETDYDVDIEIMELAHALRVDSRTISAGAPYLRAGKDQTVTLPYAASRRIGLVWEVGDWDKRRSVPAELFGALASEAQLYSLQQGPGRDAAARIPATDIAVADIETLAGLIAQLDLVITVDTMIAHLCGALGAPVWTMLHVDCDWRWPVAASTSVWYPTMTLFHQDVQGSWEPVIEQIATSIRCSI